MTVKSMVLITILTRMLQPSSWSRRVGLELGLGRVAAMSTLPSAKRTESSSGAALILGNRRIRNVMAPMVAQSDHAFRQLGRNYGCDLCFTQMIHAKQLMQGNGKKRENTAFQKAHLDMFPVGTLLQYEDLTLSQQNCLEGLPPTSSYVPYEWKHEGPLVAQLAGHDPELMVDAAHLILERSGGSKNLHGIDVNLGCPQGIARKGRYGAFLIEDDEELVCTILKDLRRSLPSDVAVSAKIRIPPNHDLLEDRILKLMDTGIDFLTVHGRTLQENKVLVGPSRTNLVQKAVQVAQRHTPGFPVIANGGVETHEDIERLLQETGATAIMSSESLLETPTLFERRSRHEYGSALLSLPATTNGVDTDANADLHVEADPRALLHHQFSIGHEYLDLCTKFPPVPGSLGHDGGSFNVIKAHLFKMFHRYLQGEPKFRQVLADYNTKTLWQVRQLLYDMEQHYSADTSNDLLARVSDPNSSWYRRHRNAAPGVTLSRRGDDYRKQSREVSMDERKNQAQTRIAELIKKKVGKAKKKGSGRKK